MKLSRLSLENFRNYTELNWFPSSGINIISGNNAQGKTNLLEAIFFCTAGRSFRTSREKDLIHRDKGGCRAFAILEGIDFRREISASVSGGGRTCFQINGQRQARNKIFLPVMSVSFSPTDMDLIKGSPAERRKWVDMELGPFDMYYLYNLDNFERVIQQRNNILKRGFSSQKIYELIEPWNKQMFFYGSCILFSRLRLLKNIFPYVREVFSGLTSGREDITYNYLSSVPLEKGAGRDELKRIYEETVMSRFHQEMERQQSVFGPHRDDIVFMLNGSDVRRFGSRGQQRSVLLALKISLMKLYYAEFGEYPLLILDDVFMELDGIRRRGLEKLIRGEVQAFITAERAPEGGFDGEAEVFTVSGGKIYRGEE